MLLFVIPKKTSLVHPPCTSSNSGPDLHVFQIIKSSHQVLWSCYCLCFSEPYHQPLFVFTSRLAGLFFIQRPLSFSVSIRSSLAVIRLYGCAVVVWQSPSFFLTRYFKYLCPSSCPGADALEMFVCRLLLGVTFSIDFLVRLFTSVNSHHVSSYTPRVVTGLVQDLSNMYVYISFY